MELTGSYFAPGKSDPTVGCLAMGEKQSLFKSAQITLELLGPFMGELFKRNKLVTSTKSINRLIAR